MSVCVFGSVLMDRQMGQFRRTVDEGFTLQLALSPPLCSKHTFKDTKKVVWHCVYVCVCTCVCGWLLVWQLPWHQVGRSNST